MEAAGLLLLTGGLGRRFGGPKHLQAHPGGGSWGGHLVAVFGSVFPQGPVQLLGQALPDHSELPALADPSAGPAVALRHWADLTRTQPQPRRWWVVPCDQLRWTPELLITWHQAAVAADPAATHWVMARHSGRLQPLGGFLAASLLPLLATLPVRSLMAMADALPSLVLDSPGGHWLDVDTPEALQAFLAAHPHPPPNP